MTLVITNAVKFRAAVAQTLHNLLKTLHKCVLIHLLSTVIVNIVQISIKM